MRQLALVVNSSLVALAFCVSTVAEAQKPSKAEGAEKADKCFKLFITKPGQVGGPPLYTYDLWAPDVAAAKKAWHEMESRFNPKSQHFIYSVQEGKDCGPSAYDRSIKRKEDAYKKKHECVWNTHCSEKCLRPNGQWSYGHWCGVGPVPVPGTVCNPDEHRCEKASE